MIESTGPAKKSLVVFECEENHMTANSIEDASPHTRFVAALKVIGGVTSVGLCLLSTTLLLEGLYQHWNPIRAGDIANIIVAIIFTGMAAGSMFVALYFSKHTALLQRQSVERKRLLGITFLAIGNILGAVPLLLFGSFFVLWRGESAAGDFPLGMWILLGGSPLVLALAAVRQLAAVTEGGDIMAKLMGISPLGGLVLLLCGAFGVAVGVGLWRQRKWARISCITLAPLNFALSVLVVHPPFQLPLLALYAGITWYMFRVELLYRDKSARAIALKAMP
jgi:hypothetical protein